MVAVSSASSVDAARFLEEAAALLKALVPAVFLMLPEACEVAWGVPVASTAGAAALPVVPAEGSEATWGVASGRPGCLARAATGRLGLGGALALALGRWSLGSLLVSLEGTTGWRRSSYSAVVLVALDDGVGA